MATFYAKYPASISAGSGVSTVQGEGTAGTPVGGILTIQGDPSGTPVPISGSISATNPSVAATGGAVPASATYVGMIVAGNLTGLPGTASGLKVDGSAVTQPVSGTVAVSNFPATQPVSGTVAATQSGTWNITNVSGTVSLPTGAATEATLTKLPVAQASTTSGQSGALVQGAVTTAAPSYTTAQTSPLSLTTAGALRVDASSSTQPVSGTVTLGAGSAIAGKVGIDQTTPGTTNGVQVNAALPAGTNKIGALTTVDTVTAVTTVSTVTAVTAITNALPAGTNAIGSVIPTATAAAVWQAEGTTAAASVTNGYVTILTPSAATKSIFLRNNTNNPVGFSFDAGVTTNVILDSGDQMVIDYVANGVIASTSAIQIKYTASAPTTGSVRVNAYH